MSMITATSWVPRGFAAPFPTKYTFDEEEFKRIAELAKLQLDDANEELDEARNAAQDNGADQMEDVEDSDDEISTKDLKSKEYVSRVAFVSAVLIHDPENRMTTLPNMIWSITMTMSQKIKKERGWVWGCLGMSSLWHTTPRMRRTRISRWRRTTRKTRREKSSKSWRRTTCS
jgi:hypothetical protein